MTDLNLLWSTPFLRTQTDNLELAQQLKSHILKCETDGFRKKNSPQRSHLNVFESQFDFLSWQHETVQEFKKLFLGHLGGFVKMVNGFSDEQVNNLKINNHCWFHITRNQGYFQPHNHPNASWSAIYCVTPGDDNPLNESNSGSVIFQDPRMANSYLDPANSNLRRDMSFNSIRLRLKIGEILIFPSYLYHFVEPYLGEEPRITIAANFWFAT